MRFQMCQYTFSLNSGNDYIAAGDIVQRIGTASHTMGLKCMIYAEKVGITNLTVNASVFLRIRD
jgi:hypothetical protein